MLLEFLCKVNFPVCRIGSLKCGRKRQRQTTAKFADFAVNLHSNSFLPICQKENAWDTDGKQYKVIGVILQLIPITKKIMF